MTADWQTKVIIALTNMLEEACCSSRLAYTETCSLTRVWKTRGNMTSFSPHIHQRNEFLTTTEQYRLDLNKLMRLIKNCRRNKPRSSQRSSRCRPCPWRVFPAVWPALQRSTPPFCPSLTRHPVWTPHSTDRGTALIFIYIVLRSNHWMWDLITGGQWRHIWS